MWQTGLGNQWDQSYPEPFAFQSASHRSLQRSFAEVPPGATGTRYDHQQLITAGTGWASCPSITPHHPPDAASFHPGQQINHQYAPHTNQLHMLPGNTAAPSFQGHYQHQQQRQHAGLTSHFSSLPNNASAPGLSQQQQQQQHQHPGIMYPAGAGDSMPPPSGMRTPAFGHQQHPLRDNPGMTRCRQSSSPNVARPSAAQRAQQHSTGSAKRLRLSPIHKHTDGFRSPAEPAIARPNLPSAEDVLNPAMDSPCVVQRALQSLQPEASSVAVNHAAPCFAEQMQGSELDQQQQHGARVLNRTSHHLQLPARQHPTSLAKTAASHDNGAQPPARGVRPSLLAELAEDLGVSAPAVLPKCPAFVPHRPKQHRTPGRKQHLDSFGHDRMMHASGRQHMQLAGLAALATRSLTCGLRLGLSLAGDSKKKRPPSHETEVGADLNGQQHNGEFVYDAAPAINPGMFVTAGSRRPIEFGSASPKVVPDAAAAQPAVAASRQMSSGGRQHNALSDQDPDVASGKFAASDRQQPVHQESPKLDASDAAPDVAPGRFMTASAASSNALKSASGHHATAGSHRCSGQHIRDQQPAGLVKRGLRKGQQPDNNRSSASRRDFLSSFAVELANLSNPDADEFPKSDCLGPSSGAELLESAPSQGAPGDDSRRSDLPPCKTTMEQPPALAEDTPRKHDAAKGIDQKYLGACDSILHQSGAEQHADGQQAQGTGHDIPQVERGDAARRISLDQGVLAGLGDTQMSGQRWSGSSCHTSPPEHPEPSIQPPAAEQGASANKQQPLWPQYGECSRPPGTPEHFQPAADHLGPAVSHQPAAGTLQFTTAAGLPVHVDPARLQQGRRLLDDIPDGAAEPMQMETAPVEASGERGTSLELATTAGVSAAIPMATTDADVGRTELGPVPASLPGSALLQTASGRPITVDAAKLQQARKLLGHAESPQKLATASLQTADGAQTPNAPLFSASASGSRPVAIASHGPVQLATAAGKTIQVDPVKLQRAKALLQDDAQPGDTDSNDHQSSPVPSSPDASALDQAGPGVSPEMQGSLHSLQTAAGKSITIDPIKLQQAADFLRSPNHDEQALQVPSKGSLPAAHVRNSAPAESAHTGLPMLQTAAGRAIAVDPARLQQAQALLGDADACPVDTSFPPAPLAALGMAVGTSFPDSRVPAPGGCLQLRTADGHAINIDPVKLQRAQALLRDDPAPNAAPPNDPMNQSGHDHDPCSLLAAHQHHLVHSEAPTPQDRTADSPAQPTAVREAATLSDGSRPSLRDISNGVPASCKHTRSLNAQEPGNLVTSTEGQKLEKRSHGLLPGEDEHADPAQHSAPRKVGLQTASGMPISISAPQLKRARALLQNSSEIAAPSDQPAHLARAPSKSAPAEGEVDTHMQEQLQAPTKDVLQRQASGSGDDFTSASNDSNTAVPDADPVLPKDLGQCETPHRSMPVALEIQTPASGQMAGLQSSSKADTEPGPRQRRSGRSRLATSVSASTGSKSLKAAEGPPGVNSGSFKVPRRGKFKTPMRKLAMTKVTCISLSMNL